MKTHQPSRVTPWLLSTLLCLMGGEGVPLHAQTLAPATPAITDLYADATLAGIWYDVAVECPFCLTFENQTLGLGQVTAMLKYSDRIELTPAAKTGKLINRTQGTETVQRPFRLFVNSRKQQVIFIQYIEGDGERAAELYARVWVLTPMGGGKLLYGKRYQISAFSDDAFESRGKNGYKAKDKYLPAERILVLLDDVRIASLNEQRRVYQPSDQVRFGLDGAVAYVREGLTDPDLVQAKQEAADRARERVSRETLYRTLVQKGDAAYAEERYDDALNQYKAASAILPEAALVHANLGAVYQVQNKLPEAEAAYRLALELDPSDIDSIFNQGSLMEQQGRLTEALELYRQVQEKRPQDAEARDKVNKLSARLKR